MEPQTNPEQSKHTAVSHAGPARATGRELWPAVGFWRHVAAIFILGTVIMFAYANTLQNTGFALDNKFLIIEDPRLRPGSAEDNKRNVELIFQQDYWYPKAVSGLYRPLTTLSYRFNYAVLGHQDKAAGYHWINFLLHWAVASLLYFVVLVLLQKILPAFFTAAVFGVHPITTESVANIIGRADQFATISVLGGLLLYAKSTRVDGWRKIPWLAGLSVITIIGVFCKESAVVVLGVIGLYDIAFRMEKRHPNWLASLGINFGQFFLKGYIAVLPAFVALWHVRSTVFGKLRPPELPFVDNPLVGADFWAARMTAFKVIGNYIMLLIWPASLSCDYSYNQIPIFSWSLDSLHDWLAVASLIMVIVLAVIAVRQHSRNKAVFFCILFFFGTLLPTSNLFPKLGEPFFKKESWVIGSIMAERFLYMPSIGFAGCLVLAVYALARKITAQIDVSEWAMRTWLQVIARGTLVVIIVAYGVRTAIRNMDWENDVKLWTAAVKVCPNSFKTHKSLAYALYETDPEGKNIDRIIEEGEKAVAVMETRNLPDIYKTSIVYLHLGAYYRIKGDTLAQRAPDGTLLPTAASAVFYQKSADALTKAVPVDRAFNTDNRQKELRRGKTDDQIPDIGNHEVYWNLGLSYMRLGKYDEALDAYLYMRHLTPANPDAYLSIASAHLSANRLEEAAVSLIQTLLIDNNRQEAMRLIVEIYRQIDKNNCAVLNTPTGPALNSDCAIVRSNMCAAFAGLSKVFLDNRQKQIATSTAQTAISTHKCPPEPFLQFLPGIVPSAP